MTHAERRQRREQARTAVADGEPLIEVARRLGLSTGTIRDYCVGVKPGVRPPDRAIKIIAALFDASRSMSDVARSLGVSRQRVHAVYHSAASAGVPLPLRGRENDR